MFVKLYLNTNLAWKSITLIDSLKHTRTGSQELNTELWQIAGITESKH